MTADRGVVQRTFFAAPTLTGPAELYARALTGGVRRERSRLRLDPGARATTETWFGRFPAAYYQRWTAVTQVTVVVPVRGAALVELRASDGDGQARTIAAHRTGSAASGAASRSDEVSLVRLEAGLDRFLDGGSLWIEVEAGDEPVTVQPIRWECGGALRERQTWVVICTFDRRPECLQTLARLAGDPEVLDRLDRVLVVDQGRASLADQPGFAEVADALGGRLQHVRQRNLGGSGGFTRGLHEVSALGGGHPHALLMDDDIELEPESVLRAAAFTARSTVPVVVGSPMLQLLHPTRLHHDAETVSLSSLTPGVQSPGGVQDMDLSDELPHRFVEASYNGWFSCLIPAEALAATGLPLPLFLLWDDIEWGLRAGERGHPTVSLPGASVWHADFDWKDNDDWSGYFLTRNALVTAAVHGQLAGSSAALVLARQLLGRIAGMRYALAATTLLAIEDFLTGPDVLADGGVSAVAAVRALRLPHVEALRRSPAQVAELLGQTGPAAEGRARPGALTLGVRLARQLVGRVEGSAAFPVTQSGWAQVCGVRTAVVTDAGRDAQRVRHYDRGHAVALARRGAVLLTRLAREAPRMEAAWQAALPALASRANWQRLFEDPAS